ncbi:MAG TPA: sensor histidine kinase [Thermoanaerobaculia bacterium]
MAHRDHRHSSASSTAPPPEYTPQARAERLIALGRLILACFSLLGIYLEPSTPARFQEATYSFLGAYTLYAAIVLLLAWRLPVPSRRWRLASHVTDLILFTVFINLTEGPASPFFLYFVFSLFCATLRFRWRGIVVTGAAATLIYLGIAVGALILNVPTFEWSRFAVRVSYLGVITALLAYVGVYQEQLRSELATLASWPHGLHSTLDAILRRTLPHVAAVVRARRVLLVWEESEEPWVWVALWSGSALRVERVPPGRFAMGELHDASFLVQARPSKPVMVLSEGIVIETDVDPVGESLRTAYSITDVVGVTIESESVSGRLFALEVENATSDDLVLAHVAGRLLLASFEQFFFVQQVRQTASAEERLRLARDLHDGVIQSLSGVAIQLESIRHDAPIDLDGALSRIERVQLVLEGEQRELRDLVRELRPTDLREDGAAELDRRLRQIAERYLLEWSMTVNVTSTSGRRIPATAALEIYRIVNESLSNAARHGHASIADVSIELQSEAVRIIVRDNGEGFSFEGRKSLQDLETMGLGPKTLRERLSKLGGDLTVESSNDGASVEASFALQPDRGSS